MTIEKLDWGYKFEKSTEAEKINEVIDVVNSLTGGGKRESCTVCNWTNYNLKYGVCDGCRDKVPEPEPKSNTLRFKINEFMYEAGYYHMGDHILDALIVLVKEHLEKEMRKFGTQPPEAKIDMCEMSKIIKNL